MLGVLLILFICVPIVEIWMLIRIGQAIGAGPTFALVILIAIIGAALARRAGAHMLFRIQETMARGETPTLAMVEGMLVFVAGLLLVIPGVLTDCVGFALLLPPVRAAAARRLANYFRTRLIIAGPGVHVDFRDFHAQASDAPPPGHDIIDVEYRDVTHERTNQLPQSEPQT